MFMWFKKTKVFTLSEKEKGRQWTSSALAGTVFSLVGGFVNLARQWEKSLRLAVQDDFPPPLRTICNFLSDLFSISSSYISESDIK